PAINAWIELASLDDGFPPGRVSHTAVWDPTNAQMLVFGGFGVSSLLNDLWAYRPATNAWVLLSPSGAPPSARQGHTAVWDTANAQMLVFGGIDSGGRR